MPEEYIVCAQANASCVPGHMGVCDAWLCPCGNTTHDQGFIPWNPGEEEKYQCLKCNRVFEKETGKIILPPIKIPGSIRLGAVPPSGLRDHVLDNIDHPTMYVPAPIDYRGVLLWLADCQAATTAHLQNLKSASKSELKRHVDICRDLLAVLESGQIGSDRFTGADLREIRPRSKEAILERLRDAVKEPQP